jgi:hypothetical protein
MPTHPARLAPFAAAMLLHEQLLHWAVANGLVLGILLPLHQPASTRDASRLQGSIHPSVSGPGRPRTRSPGARLAMRHRLPPDQETAADPRSGRGDADLDRWGLCLRLVITRRFRNDGTDQKAPWSLAGASNDRPSSSLTPLTVRSVNEGDVLGQAVLAAGQYWLRRPIPRGQEAIRIWNRSQYSCRRQQRWPPQP